MPRYFLDTSALVKRYHQESGASQVAGLFTEPGNRCFISRLAFVEGYSCFARLVREAVLKKEEFGKVISRLDQDAASGTLIVAALSARRLADATAILSTHGLTSTIRSLDAIHLATAQALHSRSRLERIQIRCSVASG